MCERQLLLPLILPGGSFPRFDSVVTHTHQSAIKKRSRRISSRSLGDGATLLRNWNALSIMTEGRHVGPDVSRSLEIVGGRSILIWVPPAEHKTEELSPLSHSFRRGPQETLLQESGSEAGRGRQQIKARLPSQLPLWVTGA